MRNPLIFAALFLVLAVVGSMFGPHDAGALSYRRGVAVYYNDFKDATTIYFRQATSETVYDNSENWMVRNPNAAGGDNIVILTGSSTMTGITIPPQSTFSASSYQNHVKVYCANSSPVEIWYEAER